MVLKSAPIQQIPRAGSNFSVQAKQLSFASLALLMFLLPSAAMTLMFSGCAPTRPKPLQLRDVQGQVTLDGQPLANAEILFVPTRYTISGAAVPISKAETNESGHFRMQTLDQREGAAAGRHRVFISIPRIVGTEARPSGPFGRPPLPPSLEDDLFDLGPLGGLDYFGLRDFPVGPVEPALESLPARYNMQSQLFVDIPPSDPAQEQPESLVIDFALSSDD